MASSFSLSLTLKKEPEHDAIYFKQDGERFTSSHTVKLNVNTSYTVQIAIRPAHELVGAVIRGERCEPKLSKEDENGIIYHLNWSTQGLELNKKGNRIEIPIVLEVKHHGPFKTTLQCKLYKDQEKVHSKWGQNLSSIVYECKIGDAGSHVDIIKERYL
ncbi:CB1 cannabinoid receptor-interacting protein 1-like [Liolophura sinensis]|uniref:CB1 cannabinoid receptor-interacting protein 1-like n=1 Tax=Liolophura sinensis TaxID=3198878 RepID=UPI00315864B4